jgi:predicted CoA-binding protein
VSGLISAAGYAVVPVQPTEAMILAAPGRDQQGEEESMMR